MKKLILLLLLSGCATQSGVMPLGDDVYSVMHQGGSALSSTSELTSGAAKEATEHCHKQGKTIHILSTKEKGAGLAQFPQSEIFFKCESK